MKNTVKHSGFKLIHLILIVLLLFLVMTLAEQSIKTDPYQINLRTRSFTPPEGVPADLADRANTLLDSTDEKQRIHLYIQLRNSLTFAQRSMLAEQGITLLDSMATTTFTASAEVSAIDQLSKLKEIRWAELIPAEDKLLPQTRKNISPHQIRKDGRIGYTLITHNDVSTESVQKIVALLNGIFVGKNELSLFHIFHTVEISITHEQLDQLANNDAVAWIEPARPPMRNMNATAQSVADVDDLRNDLFSPIMLTGEGITIGVWEKIGTELINMQGAAIQFNHPEFDDRVSIASDQNTNYSNHATHVAGTIAASGINGNAQGMAPAASLVSYDNENDWFEMWKAATSDNSPGKPTKIDIANLTYGEFIGWFCNSGQQNPCTEWNLAGPQGQFGVYSSHSAIFDSIINNDQLVIVQAAGNDRNDFGDPTSDTPADCFQRGFQSVDSNGELKDYPGDCLPPMATAKNIITVGASDQFYRMTSFSSYGPTKDGRIKPDLVAFGDNLFSTVDNSPIYAAEVEEITCRGGQSCYDRASGTSTSTPVVSGIVALLMEEARRLDLELRPSGYKALLIHTADPVTVTGNSPTGVSYAGGWGAVDANRAVNLLRDEAGPKIIEAQINVIGEDHQLAFPVCLPYGEESLKLTLAWDDPPGTPNGEILKNDLDLRFIPPSGSEMDGRIYMPTRLDPAQPALAATTGQFINEGADDLADINDDDINNVEQISVQRPVSGIWTAIVKAEKLNGPSDNQIFSLAGVYANIDADGDGLDNCADNCPLVANVSQADLDRDRIGDLCDLDIDNDGVLNTEDNCDQVENPAQENTDGDGYGDACDQDIDADCVFNAADNCPQTPNCGFYGSESNGISCPDPCRLNFSPFQEQLFKPIIPELIDAFFFVCRKNPKPIDPICFADFCPWPEFITRDSKLDPRKLMTLISQELGAEATDLQIGADGQIRYPSGASPLSNEKKIRQVIDYYNKTNDPYSESYSKTTKENQPVGEQNTKQLLTYDKSLTLLVPREFDRNLFCETVLVDLSMSAENMINEQQSCQRRYQQRHQECQADVNQPGGPGDACDGG